MNEMGSILFVYTETPLHAGSGVALGAVDLPIQRERSTRLPTVQGSGIKGSLRHAFRENQNPKSDEAENVFLQLFGPEPPERDREEGKDEPEREEFGGALSVQDARLLLFPVRTVWGGFAWLTSPLLLERLGRDLGVAGLERPAWCNELSQIRERLTPEKAFVGSNSKVRGEGSVLLEDLDYVAVSDPRVDAVAAWLAGNALPVSAEYEPFRDRLPAQLVIVADEEMKFWTEHATEVVARIRIDPKTGTVRDGALWSEESLPAESVLWSPGFFTDGRRPRPKRGAESTAPSERKTYVASELHRLFGEAISPNGVLKARLRLGGDRTVGRGIVGLRMVSPKGGA